jgi:hypothetical protein
MIDGVEPEPVDAVVPVEVGRVDATESKRVIPVKSAEAMEGDPVTTEVETSEAAEMDAMKSMESTEVASSEMTSVTPAKMTTAAMATAGIRNLRQCNYTRDKHRGHERDKLHDTLLLDGDLLAAQKRSESGEASRIYLSAHQHRVRGTMVSPVSRCSTTCQSLHSRTMRRCGSISMRSGGRATRGRGVSSCAAANAEKPAAASANTTKPIIDRCMACPPVRLPLNVFPSWRRRQPSIMNAGSQ